MHCGFRIKLGAMSAALMRDATRINEVWCEGQDRFGGPFLAGESFSAVDAFFAPVAFRWQTYGFPLDAPAIGYAQRLLALPSMRAWEAAALREPWREPEHEREALQAGTLLADHRSTGREAL